MQTVSYFTSNETTCKTSSFDNETLLRFIENTISKSTMFFTSKYSKDSTITVDKIEIDCTDKYVFQTNITYKVVTNLQNNKINYGKYFISIPLQSYKFKQEWLKYLNDDSFSIEESYSLEDTLMYPNPYGKDFIISNITEDKPLQEFCEKIMESKKRQYLYFMGKFVKIISSDFIILEKDYENKRVKIRITFKTTIN